MSSKNYKLWVYNSGTAAWVQVSRFVGMRFHEFLNQVPSMEVMVFTNDLTLQTLLSTTKPMFRITKTDSTNGTNGTIIITGLLSEPQAEEKTAVVNDLPVVYTLRGKGMWDAVTYNYNTETSFSTNIGSITNSLIAQANSQAGSTVVVAGTIDSGSSVNVLLRKDKIMPLITDLASVGDGSHAFFLQVDADSSLRPRIHMRSASNAYFDTVDPFSPRDAGRIITELTEVRRVSPIDERDRIRNAITVRYAGVGTGSTQADGSTYTDATSITAFGRRESIVIAPWIQDAATANVYAQTLLAMFKGGTDGLTRYDVELKNPELYSTAFDAKLGDVVGIEMRDGRQLTGRFFGYTYNQDEELLTVHIGYPRAHFQEDVARMERQVRQMASGMRSTTSRDTDEPDGTSALIAVLGAKTLTAGAVTTIDTWTLPANFHQAEGYLTKVEFRPTVSDASVDAHTHDLGNHAHAMAGHVHQENDVGGNTGGPSPADTTGPIVDLSGTASPGILVNGPFVIYLQAYDPANPADITDLAEWTVGHIRSGYWVKLMMPYIFALPSHHTSYALYVQNCGEITATTGVSEFNYEIYKKPLHVHDV